MTSPWLLHALTLGPLGLYFWILGLWHGDRHPRVVPGLLDHVALVLGVGGIVAFGPLGQYVTRALFGQPDWLDWLAFLSALGLIASLFAGRALRRAVVYHVDRPVILAAVELTLQDLGVAYRGTITGFEQPSEGRWVVVETSPRLRTALIEVHGREAERFLQALRPRLQRRLRAIPVSPSRVSTVFQGLAVVVILIPALVGVLSQPGPRAALRAFLTQFGIG
ncbi:MAG: hypothetical protein AB7I30_11810 [Isosphaeraceae bacterium]